MVDPKRELQRHCKRMLVDDPAWHLRDARGCWVCPYCTDVTDVVLPSSGVDNEVLAALVEHVGSCAGFDADRPGRFHSADEVKQALAQRMTRQRLAEKMRGLVRQFDVWRVVDATGCWVCPYCCRPKSAVRVTTPEQLEREAPALIVEELLDRCEAYREKWQVTEDARELVAKVEGARVLASTAPVAAIPVAEEVPAKPTSRALTVTTTISAVEAELAARAQAMEHELKSASKRQQKMMASMPDVAGYGFGVHYEPCHYLAGDFYDVIDLGGDRWAIAVGDVTGHGVDAALVMGICKKVLRMTARLFGSPKQTLVLANQEIHEDLDGKTFVSLLYGVLDLGAHTLTLARAGHEPLVVYRASTGALEQYDPGGMAIGVCTGERFEGLLAEQTIELGPGDLCLSYTDGLSEAQSASSDEEYGRMRLIQMLREHAPRGPQATIDALIQSVKRYAGDGPLEDDLTALAFWREP